MYDYLYCENGGLERLSDNVRFIPILNINTENLHFLFLKPYLHEQARACVRMLKTTYVGSCLRTQAEGFLWPFFSKNRYFAY